MQRNREPDDGRRTAPNRLRRRNRNYIDHVVFEQLRYSFADGRLGDVQVSCDVGVVSPTVFLKNADDRPVEFVYGVPFSPVPNRSRLALNRGLASATAGWLGRDAFVLGHLIPQMTLPISKLKIIVLYFFV